MHVVELAGWPPTVQSIVTVRRALGGQHSMSGAHTSPGCDAPSQSLSRVHGVHLLPPSSSPCSQGEPWSVHAVETPATAINKTVCTNQVCSAIMSNSPRGAAGKEQLMGQHG
jgi:hypothetical protein